MADGIVVRDGTNRYTSRILNLSGFTVSFINGEISIATSGGGGVPTSRTLTANAPLTGGGDLSANRSFSLSYGSGLTLSGSSLVVDTGTIATLAAVSAGYQPLNSTLTAISGGTWTGSTSLTTVGTVTTGTWHGTAIGTAYGGTGASTPSGARSNLGLVIGADVQAWDADLDALAGLGNGFPYRAAGTWGATAAGDLAVSAGSIQVTQARGLRETSGPTALAMGAVADGALLVRSGTSVIGSLFSDLMATYSAFLVALRGLSTNGFLVRGGAGTAYSRTIQAGSGVTVTNGDGTGGDPTIGVTSVISGSELDATTYRWWQVQVDGTSLIGTGMTAPFASGIGTASTASNIVSYQSLRITVTNNASGYNVRTNGQFTRTSHGGTNGVTLRLHVVTPSSAASHHWWFGLFQTLGTGLTPSGPACGICYDPARSANWLVFSYDGTTFTYTSTGVAYATSTHFWLKARFTTTGVYGVASTTSTGINGAETAVTTNLISSTQNNYAGWYFGRDAAGAITFDFVGMDAAASIV